MKSLIVIAIAAAAGCGQEIGDSCSVDSDCDPTGTEMRTCDVTQPSGYCTMQGCDYDTCPSEAVCVSFFMGSFENEMCTYPDDPTKACSLDEVCTLQGECTPRNSEVRFCMRKCSSNGDCRDGYECRTYDEMISHGGQPVLAPGLTLSSQDAPKFCAVKPAG
ncbi:MAG TPA: hypothetical protein VLX92_02565 [Kofleriaceae bacterium]|nr:hypothetical protein [Kofleriaceae bacterium]